MVSFCTHACAADDVLLLISTRRVTNANKERFVALTAQAKLITSVKQQIEAFRKVALACVLARYFLFIQNDRVQGFSKIMDPTKLSIFTDLELQV
jgi:hypothetical protein